MLNSRVGVVHSRLSLHAHFGTGVTCQSQQCPACDWNLPLTTRADHRQRLHLTRINIIVSVKQSSIRKYARIVITKMARLSIETRLCDSVVTLLSHGHTLSSIHKRKKIIPWALTRSVLVQRIPLYVYVYDPKHSYRVSTCRTLDEGFVSCFRVPVFLNTCRVKLSSWRVVVRHRFVVDSTTPYESS